MARTASGWHWPWLPFVVLAHAAALVPGFTVGGLLAWAAWRGWPVTRAYAALAQAHGHAQLVGWGGGMILGVALHFLPRLRGSRLAHPRAVPPLFALFAAGLLLRLGGQVVPAFTGATAGIGLRAVVAAGAAAELAAAAGLVLLLLRTAASGPAPGEKRAFAAVQALFAGAFASLLAALALWTAAAAPWRPAGPGGLLLESRYDVLARRLALEGFVVGVSLAMSSRLFSLFFRTRPSHPRLLHLAGMLVAAGLLAAGMAAILPPQPPARWLRAAGDLLEGLGILAGTAAVRVFASRASFPGDRGAYRVWRDPAGMGALTAYAWAVLGAVALLRSGLAGLGADLLPGPVAEDLPLHALGAGFMTLLILAVAPVMLPGFAGRRMASPALVAWAVGLGNLAALLRTAPGWAVALGAGAVPWALPAMAAGGLAGLAAVALQAVHLALSLRGDRPART